MNSNATTTSPLRLISVYPYTTAGGMYLFEKQRFEPKTFRYYNRETRTRAKPPGADSYIYRLPDVLAGIDEHRTIHWTEGEKDADALVAVGEIATSVHQGACKVTREQAEWLVNAVEVLLWVDKDTERWEVGAYDAALRHNLLVAAGVDPDRIRMVMARGRGRKDAFDHLQRFRASLALPVDKERLAIVAQNYTPASARRIGYANAR